MNATATRRVPMSGPSLGSASLGSAYAAGRDAIPVTLPTPDAVAAGAAPAGGPSVQMHTPAAADHHAGGVFRALAEVKGQAQFLLYLADQIEDSLEQLVSEGEQCQGAFLCKVLGMYSAQLESKHQGLGDRIAETCQEVYVTVREYDATA